MRDPRTLIAGVLVGVAIATAAPAAAAGVPDLAAEIAALAGHDQQQDTTMRVTARRVNQIECARPYVIVNGKRHAVLGWPRRFCYQPIVVHGPLNPPGGVVWP
jgi:hypothetical protein